ncbi:MAG: hypothetical protein WC325_08550 [Candidatus Bathyarchaeia archaeon]|jgi:hypothetical protein
MKLKILYLWLPAVILYALSAVMAGIQQSLVAVALTVGYTALMVASKWAHYDD